MYVLKNGQSRGPRVFNFQDFIQPAVPALAVQGENNKQWGYTATYKRE